MTENETAAVVVDRAIHIHRELGPGLLEGIYSRILTHELKAAGLGVFAEWPMPVTWKSQPLGFGYRADLLVNNHVIVEIKSQEEIAPVHRRQVLTYLKISERRLGLLLNFNVELMKQGIVRVVNRLPE